MKRKNSFVHNYALTLILFLLFLLTWIGQGIAGWMEYSAEQEEHQQAAAFWGEDGFIWSFADTTLENWQSEFLQLFSFVILSAYFIHRGSPQSKDGDEEMLTRIQLCTSGIAGSQAAVHRSDRGSAPCPRRC
jgi:hypothetical protein